MTQPPRHWQTLQARGTSAPGGHERHEEDGRMARPVLWSEEGVGEAFKDDEVGAGHPRMNSWSAGQAVDAKGNVAGMPQFQEMKKAG